MWLDGLSILKRQNQHKISKTSMTESFLHHETLNESLLVPPPYYPKTATPPEHYASRHFIWAEIRQAGGGARWVCMQLLFLTR